MEMMTDEEGKFPLPCSKCSFDLNYERIKVEEHPFIPSLPLCVICFDEFNNDLAIEDICPICLGDGEGELYLCSNNECNKGFCQVCLKQYLGDAAFEDVQTNDEWKCLVCDPSLLDYIAVVKESVSRASVYSTAEDTVQVDECDRAVWKDDQQDDLKDAAINQYLLLEMENEIHSIHDDILSDESIARRRDEIALELGDDNEKVDEELELWRAYYDDFLEIIYMQRTNLQESFESFSRLGLSINALIKAQVDVTEEEQEAFMLPLPPQIKAYWDEEQEQSVSSWEEHLQNPNSLARQEECKQECREPTVAERKDDIIRKLNNIDLGDGERDIDYSTLPAVFRNDVSALLLRALFHCSAEERALLNDRFSIPEVVNVAMKYANGEFKKQKRYQYSFKCDPVVLNALQESDDPYEQSLLMAYFKLGDSSNYEDIMDTEEYLDAHGKTLKTKKGGIGGMGAISRHRLKELLETEDKKNTREESTFISSLVDRSRRSLQVIRDPVDEFEVMKKIKVL